MSRYDRFVTWLSRTLRRIFGPPTHVFEGTVMGYLEGQVISGRSPISGREIRAYLRQAGYPMSAPAFYNRMSRLEDEGAVISVSRGSADFPEIEIRHYSMPE